MNIRTGILAVVPLVAVTAGAVVCGDQDLAVEFYSPRTARILKTPVGATFHKPFETRVAKAWDGTVTVKAGDVTSWSTGELEVRLDRKARTLSFWNAKGEKLFEEAASAEFKAAQYGEHRALRPLQRFRLGTDEGLYGLGDLQNLKLNQRGEHNLLTPRNVGDGIPYFASDRGYAVWWDNTSPTSVNDDPESLAFESEAGEGVDYYFLYGQTGDGCVAEMRALTGDVPMFPRWAYGYWQSKERYKTPQETVGVVERYRQAGIPLDGIVQDWQYWGENYLWNAMEFTGRDWRDGNWMIGRAHELNAKVLITIWQSFGPQTKPYRELDERGLLFPFETWPASGLEHFWPPRRDYPSGVKLCDNFSPVARDIYWNHMKRLWDAGIDGWWMDSTDPDHFAKDGDLEHMTAAGCTYREVRNAYPVSATKGVYEHQRRDTDRKRVFILTRGAGAGQQRFATSVWSGDIASSWDVLRRQIPGALNYTVTGNPQFNSDIGGFFAGRYNQAGVRGENNVNYRELYARWMQLGAFMPMMRSHGTEVPREIYLYGKPGEEVYDALVGAVKMRYRLMPYIYSLAGHITKDRASFMRPLWFDFPGDKTAKGCVSEFMMGESILVAPVLKALYTSEDNKPVGEYEGWDRKAEAKGGEAEQKGDLDAPFKGVRTHAVYLPAGTDWYDFETGRKYEGGQTVELEVTMRSMPCFVKAGGIVVLGPDVSFNGEKDWSELEVRVYPGRDGATAFYEDAFDSYDYEKGAWSEIPIRWHEGDRRVTFGDRRGGYPEMLKERVFNVKVAGVGEFQLKYNGRDESYGFMRPDDQKGVQPCFDDAYTADPAPLAVGDTLYVYAGQDADDADGFKMPGWRLYSTKDMKTWKSHGIVASPVDHPWGGENTAWAAQCIERNGKFYLYTTCIDKRKGWCMSIGVLLADRPEGPFKDPVGEPLVQHCPGDIDPTVFVDDDGQAWLYWGNPLLHTAKLNPDMVSIDRSFGKNGIKVVPGRLEDYQEGPWVWKRGGKYYLAYSSTCCPEGIGYAMSVSPEGPWVYKGHIMDHDRRSSGNHPGIVEFKGKWYCFGFGYQRYHRLFPGAKHRERRSVCFTEMTYNPDGTIRQLPWWADIK